MALFLTLSYLLLALASAAPLQVQPQQAVQPKKTIIPSSLLSLLKLAPTANQAASAPSIHDDGSDEPEFTLEELLGQKEKFSNVYKDWFTRYHAHAAHERFLLELQHEHGNQSALFVAGQSFEKRNIQGIHIWGRAGPGVKPAVIFYGTMHAREWVTTMVTEYIAYRLLGDYRAGDEGVREAVDKYDFYIIPVVNPDGFVYTQTSNRMWRKNRQRHPGHKCVGTDLNRNWAMHWDAPGGSSKRPCSAVYRGKEPLDAPETAALAAHMAEVRARQGLRLFIDWHSFGQLVMYPYGWTCNKKLTQSHPAIWLAGEAAAAMKAVHGAEYTTGTACDVMYTTSGSSEDHAFGIGGAEYAYTIELRPDHSGGNGRVNFRLPEDQILPTAEEAFAGVRRMLKFIWKTTPVDEQTARG